VKLAIVTPRYGPDVIGGAEAQARGLAEAAARHGWEVEVWTTCASSHYTWENVYPPGTEEKAGVVLRRFPISHWDPDGLGSYNNQLLLTGHLGLDDELAWLRSGAHSESLYSHVRAHSPEFDVVVVLPYASSLVQTSAWQVMGAALVIWPCLHDEPYAYMQLVRSLFERADGLMFLSPEERTFALHRLRLDLSHSAVVGGGLSPALGATSVEYDVKVDHSARPYLLYIGRLENGKNVPLLYSCVQEARDSGLDIRLVVLGRGPMEPPSDSAFDYRGFVNDREKAAVCAGALALCQPSINESFSMTIMESWLASTPVLVHADCSVTRGHVTRSCGGLYFRDALEFQEEVRWLLAHPRLAHRMGQNGRRYVLDNYLWGSVIDRFQTILATWGYSSYG